MPDATSLTPAEELKQLQDKLDKAKAQIAALSKETDQLNSKVTDLGKTVKEIEANGSSWEADRKGIQESKDKEIKFHDDRLATLKCHLSEEESQSVNDKKKAVEDEINQLAEEIQKLQGEIKELQEAYGQAQGDTSDKRKNYERQRDLAKNDKAILTDLAALRALVEGDYAKGNYERMYFYILEIGDDLSGLDVPDSKEYELRLNEAAAAVSVATGAEAKAKADLDASVAELASKQKAFSEKIAARRKDVLDSIGQTVAASPA